MIYRADFKIKSSKVRLISPVIVANIAKIYFEILDEKEALLQIQKLLFSNTLISDILVSEKFPINDIKIEKFKSSALDIKTKRDHYRAWKKNKKLDYSLSETEIVRRRIQIDRNTGAAREQYLFNETEQWYDENTTYCFYVHTLDKKVLELMELALKVIEFTGIGVDTTIGVGQIEFLKHDGKIFKEDYEIEKLFVRSQGNFALNLASTILFEEVIKDIDFVRYKVERYDGRSLEIIKPPYFYVERGSVIRANVAKPYLKKYSKNGRNIYIYTCVFPVALDGLEKEGKKC
jgi:CRISPR type III-A-associated RAMP protein Csm4